MAGKAPPQGLVPLLWCLPSLTPVSSSPGWKLPGSRSQCWEARCSAGEAGPGASSGCHRCSGPPGSSCAWRSCWAWRSSAAPRSSATEWPCHSRSWLFACTHAAAGAAAQRKPVEGKDLHGCSCCWWRRKGWNQWSLPGCWSACVTRCCVSAWLWRPPWKRGQLCCSAPPQSCCGRAWRG